MALLVDEAQHMPLETLEQLLLPRIWKPQRRSFSRLSWWASPNLKPSSMPGLAAAQTAPGDSATIVPLTAEESRDYILYRLAKVRLADNPIFTRRALQAIITQAQGIPALNILCTNVLIQGLVNGQPRISVKSPRK